MAGSISMREKRERARSITNARKALARGDLKAAIEHIQRAKRFQKEVLAGGKFVWKVKQGGTVVTLSARDMDHARQRAAENGMKNPDSIRYEGKRK